MNDELFRLKLLVHKLGSICVAVADELEEDGDRIFLGSTNDKELLEKGRELYDEYRFDSNDIGPDNILMEL